MARPQSELQELLEGTRDDGNVFFQAPTVLPNAYTKYNRSNSKSFYADNIKYLFLKRYQVTVVDRDPNSSIPDRVEALPDCIFDRFYTASGLNHWVYDIYF